MPTKNPIISPVHPPPQIVRKYLSDADALEPLHFYEESVVTSFGLHHPKQTKLLTFLRPRVTYFFEFLNKKMQNVDFLAFVVVGSCRRNI